MNDEQKATFRKQAIIPDGVSLELAHFEEFYEARKAVLVQKIRDLLKESLAKITRTVMNKQVGFLSMF